MADRLSAITKAVVEKYVRDSLVSVGALKGAPCTIKSITDITGGKRVTYEWIDDNNVSHTATMDVMNGEKGDKGDKGDNGDDYILSSADKAEIAQIVLSELPVAEEIEV